MKRILAASMLALLMLALSVSALWAQEATATTEASGSAALTITVASKASMIRLSPDDHTLAVFNNALIYDEAPTADTLPMQLIDISTGKTLATLSGYTDWVMDVAFTSDGSQMASLHRNGDVILWDVATKKMLKTIQTYALGGTTLQFMDNHTLLMRSGEFLLITLDTDSGAITHLFGRHMDTYAEFSDQFTQFPKRGDITFAAFAASPDGHWLIASTENDEVLLWDMQTAKMVSLRPPSEKYGLLSIRAFVFSKDSQQVAYFDGSDSKIHIWDIAGQKELSSYSSGGPSFGLSPDGKQIAWADRKTQSIYLADMTTNAAPVKLMELPDTQQVAPLVTSLAFTSDGKKLIVGGLFADEGANDIYVFDLAS